MQYYVFQEDCAPSNLLRANVDVCVMLAPDWHQRRASDKRTLTNVCHGILVLLLLALESIIQEAIAEYIRNAENGRICGTQCLRLDHDGTWNGWLKLGSVSSFNEDAYCGVGLPFDTSLSGGNDNI
ncbi:hypothetical protein ALT_2604 [Aspergillus lentulus]|uniref:Secreted protein CSS2 C-terminal domain-containing protein n=1 Tax=Aspergillus lentulus TaxID=293939 RepID=A0AAN4PFJ4_ASPLE|nr:hypothetical protein ALT_2604 [Aspergillus lentulus]